MTTLPFNRDSIDDELISVWKLESHQTNGQPPRREREMWVIRQDTLAIFRDSGVEVAEIKLNTSASPKWLDFDFDIESIGIYEVNGDILRICWAFALLPNLPRPSEFKTTYGDFRTVSILRRVHRDAHLPREEFVKLLLSQLGPPKKDVAVTVEFDKEAEEFISSLMREFGETPDMTAAELVVYRVSCLITEVDNGGFHQFFHNSTGEFSLETAEALRRIGAEQTAALVEAGCGLFPQGGPAKDYRQRRIQLEGFTLDQFEILRDLQNQFYARKEDLDLMLKEFWERSQ